MKRSLVIAAALALGAISASTFVSQANAAPAQNPLCKMAKGEKNPIAWSEYYGCFNTAAPVAHVAQAHAGAAADPYCKMAKGEKNPVAWNEFYGCWH